MTKIGKIFSTLGITAMLAFTACASDGSTEGDGTDKADETAQRERYVVSAEIRVRDDARGEEQRGRLDGEFRMEQIGEMRLRDDRDRLRADELRVDVRLERDDARTDLTIQSVEQSDRVERDETFAERDVRDSDRVQVVLEQELRLPEMTDQTILDGQVDERVRLRLVADCRRDERADGRSDLSDCRLVREEGRDLSGFDYVERADRQRTDGLERDRVIQTQADDDRIEIRRVEQAN